MSNSIIEAVKTAGVVGEGGAGFPTHVKLNAQVDTYIVNGAECEPLMRVDQQLFVHFTDQVVNGLKLGMESTNAKQGIIALKKKYKQAIKAVRAAVKNEPNISVKLLDDFYPAGDEHVLVYEVTGKLVPESGIPLNVGIVVNNVSTMIRISQALTGKPFTSRFITITGAVKQPQTVELPIGTSVEDAIKIAGGVTIDQFKVIMGGPMMGEVVKSIYTTPITKKTNGLIVLPDDHYVITSKEERIGAKVVVTQAACIRCELCTEVCPRYLLGHDLYPDKIMRAVAFGGKEKVEHLTSAFLCVDCGVCTYFGCPMRLDPCKMNGEVKNQLYNEGIKNPHKRKDITVHQERELRKIPVKRLVSRLNLSDYEHKAPLTKKSVKIKMVRIPLKQHIGDSAVPTVSVGDIVAKNDLIGKIPDGSLGAMIHSSIDGKVEEISKEIVIKSQKK